MPSSPIVSSVSDTCIHMLIFATSFFRSFHSANLSCVSFKTESKILIFSQSVCINYVSSFGALTPFFPSIHPFQLRATSFSFLTLGPLASHNHCMRFIRHLNESFLICLLLVITKGFLHKIQIFSSLFANNAHTHKQ